MSPRVIFLEPNHSTATSLQKSNSFVACASTIRQSNRVELAVGDIREMGDFHVVCDTPEKQKDNKVKYQHGAFVLNEKDGIIHNKGEIEIMDDETQKLPTPTFLLLKWHITRDIDDKAYICDVVSHRKTSLDIREHGNLGDQYVLCISEQDTHIHHDKWKAGVLQVGKVPAMKSSTEAELVFKDEVLGAYEGIERWDYEDMENAMVIDRERLEKEVVDNIVADVQAGFRESGIDYDKLVVAMDHYFDSAAQLGGGTGNNWMSSMPHRLMLVVALGLLLALGSQEMRRRGVAAARKTEDDDTNEKKKGDYDIEKTVNIRDTLYRNKFSFGPLVNREQDTQNAEGKTHPDGTAKKCLTTKGTTVPTFVEYVHGIAKQSAPTEFPPVFFTKKGLQDLSTTDANNWGDFKDPVERQAVQRMFHQATLDIVEFTLKNISSDALRILRSEKSPPEPHNLVNHICLGGDKQREKTDAFWTDGTHFLEKAYENTLERRYRRKEAQDNKADIVTEKEENKTNIVSDLAAPEAKTSMITGAATITSVDKCNGKTTAATSDTARSAVTKNTAAKSDGGAKGKTVVTKSAPSAPIIYTTLQEGYYLESQEPTYLQISKESARSVEERMMCAREASKLKKGIVGRGLRVTEEIVTNDDLCEEEKENATVASSTAAAPSTATEASKTATKIGTVNSDGGIKILP